MRVPNLTLSPSLMPQCVCLGECGHQIRKSEWELQMHQVHIVVSPSPQTHDGVSETSWESWSGRAGTRRGGEEVGGAVEGRLQPLLLRRHQEPWWTAGGDV